MCAAEGSCRTDVCAYLVYSFFFNDTATTEIYTLSLHDALPISKARNFKQAQDFQQAQDPELWRSEEHTSELQSLAYLVCRLLLANKHFSRASAAVHRAMQTMTERLRVAVQS